MVIVYTYLNEIVFEKTKKIVEIEIKIVNVDKNKANENVKNTRRTWKTDNVENEALAIVETEIG